MKQANIPSLSPYYVNKSGQVFNSKYVHELQGLCYEISNQDL